MTRILYIFGGVLLGVELGNGEWFDVPGWLLIATGIAMMLIADFIVSLRRGAGWSE